MVRLFPLRDRCGLGFRPAVLSVRRPSHWDVILFRHVRSRLCSPTIRRDDLRPLRRQVFFSNHRSDIEQFAREISARDVKPELEVYNSAMLEEVDHLLSLEILKPPYTINFVLHTPTQGGQRGTPQNLLDMVDRLRDLSVPQEDLRVNVSSMGPTQLPITTIGLAMGLNVRVGMEDNVLYRRGEPVESNAQLVERTVRIAHELDREPATPDEARQRLGLRGRDSGRLPATDQTVKG
jgi:3-keto-5-aminohexanoate cleavage enzyme